MSPLGDGGTEVRGDGGTVVRGDCSTGVCATLVPPGVGTPGVVAPEGVADAQKVIAMWRCSGVQLDRKPKN